MIGRARLASARLIEGAHNTIGWARRHPWAAGLAALTGLLAGVGLSLSLTDGVWGVVVMAPLVWIGTLLLIGRMVPSETRATVLALFGVALAARSAIAAGIWAVSIASGLQGFVTGDDLHYAMSAWGIVRWSQGEPFEPWVPPYWNGDAYLLGTFVYLEAAVFWVFGFQPILVELLNGLFGVVTALLLFDITRRHMGARPAVFVVVAVSLYPSIALWSALNLKDSLSLALTTVALWSMDRFSREPRLAPFAALVVSIALMESIRRYIYLGLIGLMVITVVVARIPTRSHRAAWLSAALTVALALYLVGPQDRTSGIPSDLGGATSGLGLFEGTRQAMSEGARTAYAEPKAVVVTEGQTFVVVDTEASLPPATPGVAAARPTIAPTFALAPPTKRTEPPSTASPAPTLTASPTPTPKVVVVPPGNAAPIALANTPQASNPNAIVVNPGDIVVYGKPGTTPAADAQRTTLGLRNRNLADQVQLVPAPQNREVLTITRTLAYVPKGLTYALFSPFPWDLGRAVDYATVPEMIFWYVTIAAFAVSVWRMRVQWREFTPLFLYVVGILGVLALTEGNYGTLFRHRSQVVPMALVLAAPVLRDWYDRLVGRLRA